MLGKNIIKPVINALSTETSTAAADISFIIFIALSYLGFIKSQICSIAVLKSSATITKIIEEFIKAHCKRDSWNIKPSA